MRNETTGRANRMGIILQGGGALGAYEWGVLQRLYAEDWFKPEVISGVSIGAITAATIASPKCKDPVEALKTLWGALTISAPDIVPAYIQRHLAVFGSPQFYHTRHDYYAFPSWTSYYDTTPLLGLLESIVDFKALNNDTAGPQLIVTATDVVSGEITPFSNRGPYKTEITPKHILASGSLPPGFPMTEIGGRYFWDGGLFSNTPLTPVIESLDSSDDAENILIVVNLFPSRGSLPTNMMDVHSRILEITFSNKISKNVENTERINDFCQLVKAIDPVLPASVKAMEAWQNLVRYTVIGDTIYITNDGAEPAGAAMDFSAASIESRRASGFADAGAALADRPNRLAKKAAIQEQMKRVSEAMGAPRTGKATVVEAGVRERDKTA
ncbi:MAG: patatin-like phospholipase family protein [Gammaproteobacteria bacterium]|nr:patatin-like phospholipase family protein [Gammaproteobacteria bacterium]